MGTNLCPRVMYICLQSNIVDTGAGQNSGDDDDDDDCLTV